MTDNQKLRLAIILGDIQEQIVMDIPAKFDLKQDLLQIAKRCKKLIKYIDNNISEEEQLSLGDTSDNIKELILNYLKL